MDEAGRRRLEAGYAAIGAGDVDAALRHVAPDIEVASSGAFLDEGRVYRGHDGVAEFMAMLAEAFEELSYEIVDLIELGDDRVLTLLFVTARGRESGLEVRMQAGHIWTFRGDEAVRLEAFADHDSARAAAGVRP